MLFEEQLLDGELLVVALAPTARHAVRGREDDVLDRLDRRDVLGERCARQSDARPELGDVRTSETLAEDVRGAARRVHAGRGNLQERRLAGTVTAEDDPPVGVVDGPGDLVEDVASGAADGDVVQGEDLGHAPSLTATPPGRGAAPRRSAGT